MNHKQECLDNFARHQASVDEYNKDWPNHCEHCKGWGGAYSHYDPSPAGVSLSPGYMTDYDPCPVCSDKGNCPRCGQAMAQTEDGEPNFDLPCPSCGWTEKDGGEPTGPECECWYEQWQEDEKLAKEYFANYKEPAHADDCDCDNCRLKAIL